MNEKKIVDKTADKTNWPIAARELWQRIAAHSFEDPDHALTFTARLARDHGWSLDHARRAVEEYRRFCFLAIAGSAQVTPSEEVDEVWHQHLTYSRDYWDIWCKAVLRRPLHHQPTKGGTDEGTRFADQYAETLAAYETWFGPPDPDFWPGTASRFAARPRYSVLDRRGALVIPLPAVFGRLARRLCPMTGAAALAAGILTPRPAAAGFGVLDLPGDRFLKLYVVLAILAVVGALGHHLLVRFLASRERPAERHGFTPVELALMRAGEGRAVDVLALDLMRSGQIRVADGKIEVLPRPFHAGPSLGDILRRHGTEFSRDRLVEILSPSVGPPRDRLARERWVLSREQEASIRSVTMVLVGTVAALGLAKMGIGFWRGKPIGLLVVTTIVMAVLGVIVGRVKGLASMAGLFRMREYREENARALRAPRHDEVLAAFAVLGAVALVGTPLAAYADVLPKPDGGSSGSGCGGDGGGGGGCGGCGGD